jgi:DNA polymerase III delta prime subunit
MSTVNGTVAAAPASPSWESKVIDGLARNGLKFLAYGPPGVGKTSLAKAMPKTILIDYDRGANQAGVKRLKGPPTWADALALVRSIAADPRGYKTIAIDTLDPLEDLATAHVCRAAGKKSLADIGGFGAGYDALKNEWRLLLSALDVASESGMNVLLLCHSIVRQTSDPQLGPYEVFTTNLQKKTWALTSRWCDIVGFCAYEASRVKDEKRAIYTGRRELLTTSGSGYIAKERFALPRSMELRWDVLEAAIQRFYNNAKPEDVIARIHAMAKGTAFEAPAVAFIADAQGDVRRLLQVEDALKEKLAEVAKEAAEAAKEGATA